MPLSVSSSYSAVSRFNHWLVAVVVIGMLAFGLYLENAGLERAARGELMAVHKAIGVILLVFVLWRVGYRLAKGFPASVAVTPKWQLAASKAVHWLLLGGIVVMPLSGLLMTIYKGRSIDVFGLITIPAQEKIAWISAASHTAHGWVGKLLVALILVHIFAALKHHFIDRDATLTRMINGRSTRDVG